VTICVFTVVNVDMFRCVSLYELENINPSHVVSNDLCGSDIPCLQEEDASNSKEVESVVNDQSQQDEHQKVIQ